MTATDGRFKPGNKLSKGKQKGSISKLRKELQETMAEHDFNPAEAFMYLYDKAKVGIESGNRQEKPMYLKIATDIVKELASYSYPRLAAVQVSQKNPLDGMTHEQKLEAMKQAVLMLEAQGKNEPRDV